MFYLFVLLFCGSFFDYQQEKYVEDGNLDSKSEIDLEFCANPQPELVYWKAGDCRLSLE